MKEAKKIVVLGGGPSGVEQAGELAMMDGAEREITIIHAKDYLINDQVNDEFQKKLNTELNKLNIKVLLGL